MSDVDSVKTRPIREGLYVLDGEQPFLIGSRDRETGEVFFPPEVMNPRTHQPDTLEAVNLAATGHIVTYTTIQRGLPGFDSPYALAVIQFDEGPTFIAQLHEWQGQLLKRGTRVELVVARIKSEKDGTEILGPKFRPIR